MGEDSGRGDGVTVKTGVSLKSLEVRHQECGDVVTNRVSREGRKQGVRGRTVVLQGPGKGLGRAKLSQGGSS